MKIIRKVPLSIIAIFLALLTCGNLLMSYSKYIRPGLAALALVLLGLFSLRLVLDLDQVKEDLASPLTASVIPALSMGIMVLASYVKVLDYSLGKIIYLGGIVLHLCFIGLFSKRFLKSFSLARLYPTWFIVYVGIATGGIIAPQFNMEPLGRLLFYFGCLAYLILMPLNIYRFAYRRDIEKSHWPSLGVFCSPASLCLASYVNSFDNHNLLVLAILVLASQAAYFFAVSQVPKLLEGDFYPSFASFTFPMAVSALALKTTQVFLLGQGYSFKILNYLVKFEEAMAIFIIAYVLIRYGSFIATPSRPIASEKLINSDWDIDMD